MAERYVVTLQGTCMGFGLLGGERVWVDPTAPIEPLDLVSVSFRKGSGIWDSWMRSEWSAAMGSAPYPEGDEGMVKIFLTRARVDDRDVILFAHLHPPCLGIIGVDELETMHRVISETNLCSREQERSAFKLISSFRGRAGSEPINAAWRPPVPVVSLRADAA